MWISKRGHFSQTLFDYKKHFLTASSVTDISCNVFFRIGISVKIGWMDVVVTTMKSQWLSTAKVSFFFMLHRQCSYMDIEVENCSTCVLRDTSWWKFPPLDMPLVTTAEEEYWKVLNLVLYSLTHNWSYDP